MFRLSCILFILALLLLSCKKDDAIFQEKILPYNKRINQSSTISIYLDKEHYIEAITLRYLNLSKLEKKTGIFKSISTLKRLKNLLLKDVIIKDLSYFMDTKNIEVLDIQSIYLNKKIFYCNASKNLCQLHLDGSFEEICFEKESKIRYMTLINRFGKTILLDSSFKKNKYLEVIILTVNDIKKINFDAIAHIKKIRMILSKKITKGQQDEIINKNPRIEFSISPFN